MSKFICVLIGTLLITANAYSWSRPESLKFPLYRDCLTSRVISVQQGLPSNVAVTFQLKSINCPWSKRHVTNLKQTQKGEGVRIVEELGELKTCEEVNGIEECKVDWKKARKIRRDADLEAFNASFNAPISFKVDVLLLVDLSGSIRDDKKAMENLKKSALSFVDKIFEVKRGEENRPVKVAVYSFDGREEIKPLLGDATYSNDPMFLKTSITNALDNCKELNFCFDKSTNLYGGIMKGLEQLKIISRGGTERIRARQFIVFTDGKDRAGRETLENVLTSVRQNRRMNVSVHAVGLGKKVDSNVLSQIAQKNYIHAKSARNLGKKFVKLASNVRNYANSFYTLRYCSAKRAPGMNTENLVVFKRSLPWGYKIGTKSFEYDSAGFSGGCDLENETQWSGVE